MVVGSNPAAPTNSLHERHSKGGVRPLVVPRAGFLASQFGLTLGTFDLTDWTPIAGIHAGAMVTITDTAAGLNTFFRMYSIEKAFHSNGRQDLTVSYGRYRPSIARNPDLTRLRPMTEEREDDAPTTSAGRLCSTSAIAPRPSWRRTPPAYQALVEHRLKGRALAASSGAVVLVALVTVPGRSVSRTRP